MSEHYCDVSLGEYDGNDAQLWRQREVVGRKLHRCYECGEDILVGVRHEVINGKWDGRFRLYRFCLACSEVQREFSESGRIFGNTWEVFKDEWNNGATLQGCLNRLTTSAAKALMTRQYRAFKRLDAP